MKLENQVCTEPQALKLKELRISQSGVFRWHLGQLCSSYYGNETYPAAFTAMELWQMMPARTSISKGEKKSHCKYWWGDFFDGILRERLKGKNWHQTIADTKADAIVQMLIYLLENNLTTPEEVNKRLSDN